MKFLSRGWSLGGAAVILLSLSVCAVFGGGPAPEKASEKAGGDWALHRLKRPNLPTLARSGWARNGVDFFIQARLDAKGLTPSAAADRLTLLKRVTYDLTGLAPTIEERNAFLNDASADAYEKVVDRLLASPHFGERWAQHWLDLVRYSETDGFKVDRYRPDAWRYRDYVIRSFNGDLPYDRFVRQQIAGDELEPDNPDAIIATGYLRLHPEETNGANYRKIRQDILDDITDVTGLTFMGMTVGCARCHDHKFDPISQDDYYELQAFFAGVLPRDNAPLLRGEAEKQYREKLAAWERATAAVRKELDDLVEPERKAIFEDGVVAMDDETQQALKMPETQRSAMQMQLAAYGVKQLTRRYERAHRRLKGEQKTRYEELSTKLAGFESMKPTMPTAMAVVDAGPNPPPTYRLGGGDWRRPKREVKPDVPDCIEETHPAVRPPRGNAQTSGRRSALAAWLTEADHPLTSRVIVNRLWQQYFGSGLVATPSDFGVAGDRPTHPELVDYLASELVAKNWSLKTVHRLIVTSATYRQSSAIEQNADADLAMKIDPANKLLWHARVRRRDAESIRDTALEASGLLNRRMFSISALPELPPGVSDARGAWSPDAKEEDRNRRSIYVFNCRNLALPLFAAFDAPNRSLSCATRSATTTAPQALLMLNGEFSGQQAKALAEKLASQSSDLREIIRAAYRRVLGREATGDDLSHAELFVRQQSSRIARDGGQAPDIAAVTDFCHALLNSAEFLNVE